MSKNPRVEKATFYFLPAGCGGYDGADSAAILDDVDEGHPRKV